jgi:membrane protein implicated in regulation of membrane protease activity
VKVSGTLATASLLVPAAVLIIGAVMWANGATTPGITLMVLILVVTAFWHRSLRRRNNHRD